MNPAMIRDKITSADEAIALIRDGDVVAAPASSASARPRR